MKLRYQRLSQLVDDLMEHGNELEVRACQLEAAHVMDRDLLSHTSEKLRYQQHLLDDAIEIAGRMSVLFPATETVDASAHRLGREAYEIAICSTMMAPTYDATVCEFALQTEQLKLLITKVSKDHMQRALHAHVKFMGNEMVYGATESAVWSMPRKNLIEIIVRELGAAIGNKIVIDKS